MANQITNYQCPACTGPLHFDSATGRLQCDYCGSSFSVEEVEAMYAGKNEQAETAQAQAQAEAAAEQMPEEAAQWDMENAGGEWGRDAAKMRAYSCPSCGAELLCDETTAATSCPYCGNPTIIPGQFGNTKKPDLIIPFKLDKDAAVAALKKHYAGKPLLPKAFASANHIQEIKGVYVPFWLFDAQVEADMSFNATRSMVHETPREIITETDHFMVHRRGTMDFQRIPVDASSKMPDAHMDAIEPYDYKDLKPFSLSYLPGFLADKYDVSQEESQQRANSRCASSAEQAIESTVAGYQTCVPVNKSFQVRAKGVKYALLPVWMLSTQWNGQNYLFAMNGQTGKLIGDLPIDKTKMALWCAGAFAVVTGLFSLLFM